MRVRMASLLATAVLLAGCTLTLPVRGQFQSSGEAFAGRATGHMDGAGELSLILASGATCKGLFVYTSTREGSGTFNCSDGRSGPFKFVSTGQRGTGMGELDGERFTFTFG